MDRLKQQPGQGILIFGSGDFLHRLMQNDSSMNFGSWFIPLWGAESVSLKAGAGTTLGIGETRTGVVLLRYQLAGKEAKK
ncbi:MAG: hypothetical protein E6K99_02910 [Thaumarchaeota archaeon]|nr:MAG: hypothetical protein E6K99_02910 [Nitrososphaerota archaeon]